MKTKSLIVFAAMTLVLLVSACGPTTGNQQAVRTLGVSGSGQANLAPDIAYIYVGVHTEKVTAAEGVAENTTQTQTVIKAIKDFGINEKDIRTTNFSIYPQDKYDPQTGSRRIWSRHDQEARGPGPRADRVRACRLGCSRHRPAVADPGQPDPAYPTDRPAIW